MITQDSHLLFHFRMFQLFKHIIDWIKANERAKSTQIKTIRTDNGTTFKNKDLLEYTTKAGIKHELTTPYTPQQNGRIERFHQTLFNKIRSLLAHGNLPYSFWVYAALHACLLYNVTANRGNGYKTPFEVWTGNQPAINDLRVFGCLAYAHQYERDHKLAPKSKKFIHIGNGISQGTKAWKLLDPESKRIILSRDVIFIENEFPLQNQTTVNITTALTHIVDDVPAINHYEEFRIEMNILKGEF